MKRYTGQQALYEAISRTKAKSQRRSILERLLPNDVKVDKTEKVEPPEEPPAPVAEEPKAKPQVVEQPAKMAKPPVSRPAADKPLLVSRPPIPAAKPVVPVEAPEPPRPVQTWLRPKAVQVHNGRIEVSLPYTVGVTVALGAVLLMLAAFRLGQSWSASVATTPSAPTPARSLESRMQPTPPPVAREASTPRVESTRPEVAPEAGSAEVAAAPAAQGESNNWIVLTHYAKEADLQFVVKHFADHGIDLAVVPLPAVRETLAQRGLSAAALNSYGDGFLLVTRDTYDNPGREGSSGYRMVQEIARVGALYKGRAPQGYESFGPRYFNDAYGMKIR